ncbi:GNAT family N-acetyltransferase [Shewanella schlegeliana]|uniref:GNAT family N-acetyltransferase n=1 Tax=Shewanella schlegeliana TaxID=190308 RepID=A0ABS1T3I9_9GAMM|nr:GNAT family N-acetyltransferase [Shewanella schlegeliana]MBL4915337.1 GNAT family N-acetyltransferase [Shewanella schlegeliana]MCL1111499.1 GNAT family N-acetyltransferase [Shewanella schlegeliana]GIU35009.1 N-acetyltransferase [Shewanella schlegeliana]
MKLQFLADNESALPQIAKWYSDEWGYIGEGRSTKDLELKLRDYLNHDKLPLIILAQDDNELLGAAQLRFHEMDIYPEREHWLGGVYVALEHRGEGIAKALVSAIIDKAKELGINSINLQTEDLSGGLYSTLGWQPVEQVTYHGIKVLVMEKSL